MGVVGARAGDAGQQRRVSGTASLQKGHYYNGTLTAYGWATGRVAILKQWSAEPSISINQVDLPTGTASGLRTVQDILDGIEDVHFCQLTSHDVVRHKLISDIVDAYARHDAQRELATKPVRPAAAKRKPARGN